jgi:HK97 family phage major capsid protein
LDTKEMRKEAEALLLTAQSSLEKGEIEQFKKMSEDAKAKMALATEIDEGREKIKALSGDFNRPMNEVPVASKDVAKYNPDDTTKRTKADYKPQTWIKGLPAMAQPMWVQEQMGDNVKDYARFQRDTFLKWMKAPSEVAFQMSATPDEKKAMQEDTDAEGGFFVPEEFVNQVVHDPGVPGGRLRPYCNVIRVASKDGYIPSLASATWAAIAEEAAYSDQTPTVGQVAFSLEKSGGLVKVTRELLEDSAINLPAMLSQIFQESAGRFEDVGIISGNGTTQYAGIMGASPDDYTMANATSVVAADLTGIYFTLEEQFRSNATWIMKSAIASLITSIASTAAGVHAISNLTDAPADFILGRPNVMSDTANGLGATITATERIALFGDLKQYAIFDRAGFSIRRNDSLYQENDQIGFFASRRGDGQLTLASAFKMCRAAAS